MYKYFNVINFNDFLPFFKKLKRFFATKQSSLHPVIQSIMSSETQQTQQVPQLQRSMSHALPHDNGNMAHMPEDHSVPAECDVDMNSFLEPSYQPPTKPYWLVQTARPLEEMCQVTNNLQCISPEYIPILLARIGQRHWATTYGTFKAPPAPESLKRVIGSDGYFLKMTTQNCNIDLIWYHHNSQHFMFWGPSANTVIQAMNHIRSRIVKYTIYLDKQPYHEQTSSELPYAVEDISDDEQVPELAESSDEDDDDIPHLIDVDGNIVN